MSGTIHLQRLILRSVSFIFLEALQGNWAPVAYRGILVRVLQTKNQ